MIGWLLRRWQQRYPGPVLAASLGILVVGSLVVAVWALRDLARGLLLRPAIAVLVLAFVTIRVMVSFKPHRR